MKHHKKAADTTDEGRASPDLEPTPDDDEYQPAVQSNAMRAHQARTGPPTIAAALDEVNSWTRKEQRTGLEPWAIFKDAIGNNATKRDLYKSLKVAISKEQAARAAVAVARGALAGAGPAAPRREAAKLRTAVAKAEAALVKAGHSTATARAALKNFVKGHVARWSPDQKLAEIDDEIQTAQALVAELAKAGHKRDPTGAAAKTALHVAAAHRSARVAELKAEVDADPMQMETYTRTKYKFEVDGITVHLYDHVDAYGTVTDRGLEGSAAPAGPEQRSVGQLIDDDPTIHGSNKEILKIVSSLEGKFGTVNTWDQADVTWGFIQWTTGRDGRGSLINLLVLCKTLFPAVFERRLHRYGIDVKAEVGLVVTLADGQIKTGKDAARHIQVDPVLTAVLAAAGEDPDFKSVQLRQANAKVGKEVLHATITLEDRKIKISDILTSERAVGGAFAFAVHGGASRLRDCLTDAIETWAKKHNIDLTRPVSEWGPGAEKAGVDALTRAEPSRTAKMAGLSDESGSYE
jgi:hypothetical protein